MDDALYAEELADEDSSTVAIADPAARIAEGVSWITRNSPSPNYLPGFVFYAATWAVRRSVLTARQRNASALACRMMSPRTAPLTMISPFAATIESKAKLAYDNVSDWLENNGTGSRIAKALPQIRLLHRILSKPR